MGIEETEICVTYHELLSLTLHVNSVCFVLLHIALQPF